MKAEAKGGFHAERQVAQGLLWASESTARSAGPTDSTNERHTMRTLLGFLMLVTATSLLGCGSATDDDDALDEAGEADDSSDTEEVDSTSQALTTTIGPSGMHVISGYQANTTILGVPVRAFWSNGEIELNVNLAGGGWHNIDLDFAVTECQQNQMIVAARFLGGNMEAGGGGFTPNSRIVQRHKVKSAAGGWQKLRIRTEGDHYVPGVCDANFYLFAVSVDLDK